MLKSCCSSSSASQCVFVCVSVCVWVCVCRACVCECVRGRVLAECAAHWARAQLPICRLLIVSPCGPFSPLNASVLLHFNELFSLSSIYNPIFWEILLCICEMRSNRTQINIYKIVISLRRLYTTCSWTWLGTSRVRSSQANLLCMPLSWSPWSWQDKFCQEIAYTKGDDVNRRTEREAKRERESESKRNKWTKLTLIKLHCMLY